MGALVIKREPDEPKVVKLRHGSLSSNDSAQASLVAFWKPPCARCHRQYPNNRARLDLPPGVITFSEVSRRYGRTYQRILKRGKIADETECYLVAGVLSDLTAAVSATERAVLQGLYEEFESAVSGRQP